jgi:2-polyprenyl-3-methyl-5-hydroxy-6-metoxy-1,4-benzoquinol methylase
MPACPLCGGSQAQPIAVYPELTWVRCSCGVVYKRSEISDPAAADFYEEGYFGSGDQGRRYTQRTSRRIGKSRRQILDVLNYVEPGPLLDIGCSVGYTLVAAQELGLTPTGADLSQYAINACRKLGFRAESGALGALPFADSEFSVITMKHVLEHTPDPRAALRDVRRMLKPGGALLIAVPDGAYHKALSHPQTYDYFLPNEHGREHFVYYTSQTLSKLVGQEGFRVVRVHSAMLHRQGSQLRQATQLVTAPFRMAARLVIDALHLRKEFWLIAIRD